MPIMGSGGGGGGGAGSVDKLVLEAGVNHDSGMNFYQTTTLSTFSKRGTETTVLLLTSNIVIPSSSSSSSSSSFIKCIIIDQTKVI